MIEYIEREAAMRAVQHAWGKGLEPSQYIEIIPAADVVEVVRCETCKKFKTYKCPMCNLCSYDDFCNFGERKDGA